MKVNMVQTIKRMSRIPLCNMDSIQCMVFAGIISADNDKYTEDVKQEVMYRYELEKDSDEIDWEFVLEPLGEDNRLLELFK